MIVIGITIIVLSNTFREVCDGIARFNSVSPFPFPGSWFVERGWGSHPYIEDIPPIRTKRFVPSLLMLTAKEWISAYVFVPRQKQTDIFKEKVNLRGMFYTYPIISTLTIRWDCGLIKRTLLRKHTLKCFPL